MCFITVHYISIKDIKNNTDCTKYIMTMHDLD